ncbi:hypothetical protein DFH09DRAFT_1067314 [Mycena vulgaris]|nr:hypothetical protein DFH09DRAFT_1067314 [Mycena vulgaris]
MDDLEFLFADEDYLELDPEDHLGNEADLLTVPGGSNNIHEPIHRTNTGSNVHTLIREFTEFTVNSVNSVNSLDKHPYPNWLIAQAFSSCARRGPTIRGPSPKPGPLRSAN